MSLIHAYCVYDVCLYAIVQMYQHYLMSKNMYLTCL